MPYALGFINNTLVASMAYFTPRNTRDIGLIEFVETLPEHRRKGISSILLSTLIKLFEKQGGLALLLCTGNPIAGKLYENHGFWYTIGDGMHRINPKLLTKIDNFNEWYFQNTGHASIREATWADLPRVSLLYNHPNPEWIIKDYLSESFSNTRYEYHFVKIFTQVQKSDGKFFLLEANDQKIVGSVILQRKNSFLEQHSGIISFRIVPSYYQQALEMLTHVKNSAQNIGISILESHVAASDSDQFKFLELAGFKLNLRLKNRLYDGVTWTDLLIYTIEDQFTNKNRKDKSNFYGARQQWQIDRIKNQLNPDKNIS
jgi:ribosomal protein S18 acetylase RimI-like enzyme